MKEGKKEKKEGRKRAKLKQHVKYQQDVCGQSKGEWQFSRDKDGNNFMM